MRQRAQSKFSFRWKLERSRRVVTPLMIREGKEEINWNFYRRRGCVCWIAAAPVAMQNAYTRATGSGFFRRPSVHRNTERRRAGFDVVAPLGQSVEFPNVPGVFLLLPRSRRNNNNTTADRGIFRSRDNADDYRSRIFPIVVARIPSVI